ncbi:MAG: hypothetical protein AAF942_00045 [Pseudomonadota bacterium]
MSVQYFVLDSTAIGYAAALAALLTYDANKVNFTPTQTVRNFSGDADYRIVKANVTEAELDGDADLADLRRANFLAGNDLCRHRFADLNEFRMMGFHMLGESERSYEGVAGRGARFSQPQNGYTATPQVQGPGYGKGNGRTHADAFNGELDHRIADGGTTISAEHQTGLTYYVCGTQFPRVSNGNPGQIDYSNGLANAGRIKMADATGLGDAGKIVVRGDYSFDPGLMLGGGRIFDRNADDPTNPLPWELYDAANSIYVQGAYQGFAGAWSVGKTEMQVDLDVDDNTVDLATFINRHLIVGQNSLSDLNGAAGRGRFYVEDDNYSTGLTAFDRVIVFDGTNYTDVTAAASDAAADDFEAFGVGATVGAYIAFVSSTPFSVVRYEPAQAVVGTGLTLEWKYGRAADHANFANQRDDGNAWTLTSAQDIKFNPRSDWAQTTEAAGEAFETTGYVVRLEITAGTVTTAGRGDQVQKAAAQCFIHRWNDSAPVHGPSFSRTCALRHDFAENAKGNYEVHNLRMIANSAWWGISGATGIKLYGVQLGVQPDMYLDDDNADVSIMASINGNPGWYAKTDRRVQNGDHEVFTHAQYGLVAAHGDDPTNYADIPDWADLAYAGEGPYINNTNLAGWTLDGVTLRHMGRGPVLNIAGDQVLDYTPENADHHTYGNLGGHDYSKGVTRRIGCEDIVSCVWYTQGTGDLDQPVLGSGSIIQNMTWEHGWMHTWNGLVDSQQPNYGMHFTGDNDKGAYSDGTGKWINMLVRYIAFVDQFEGDGGNYKAGRGISQDHDTPIVVRKCSFVRCNWAWTMHNNDPMSVHVFYYDDSAGTYTDITANLRRQTPTGPTAIFPVDSGPGDMVIFAYPTHLDYQPRRAELTISTPATGSPTLSTVYWRNDNSWAAASNVVDGTSGFTTSGTLTTDRAADYGNLNIAGTDYQAFGVRIDSGAFTVLPQASEAEGLNLGSNLDIEDYVVWKPRRGVGYSQTISGGTGHEFNSSRLRDVGCKLYYDPATQTADDDFWAWQTSTAISATPNQNATEWAARTKLAQNTDAREDSVFGSGLVIAAAA